MEKKKDITKPKTKKKKPMAFTLIELLAVIIILGILLIIAIPSVTSYISNSRKETYVDTAKNIVGSARNFVNKGEVEMFDYQATYYIPAKCLPTENGLKSPYGEFTQAYVGVTYDGNGYNYYWISTDSSEQGIKKITPVDDLNADLIEASVDPARIENIVYSTSLEGKTKILVLDDNCKTWNKGSATQFPNGKVKDELEPGDIVTIGEEEFYVIDNDGPDTVLLARYNLNVGDNRKLDATEGIQHSEVRGFYQNHPKYGEVPFSYTYYWRDKVGTDYDGAYCTSSTDPNCAYVFDSNSNLYQYVMNYKTYLESLGAEVKQARLLTILEARNLYDFDRSKAIETSYWVGSVGDNVYCIWHIGSNGQIQNSHYSGDYANWYGVRPVIVI